MDEILKQTEEFVKSNDLWIIGTETVLLVILLLWLIWLYKTASREIEALEHENHELKKLNDRLNQDAKKSQKELGQLKVLYANSMRMPDRNAPTPVVTVRVAPASHAGKDNVPEIHYEYLQEANGGRFLKLLASPERCFFRTWEEGGVRKYEFAGNVEKALANINAIFDDVCDMEGKRGGATDIENISAGTLDTDLRIMTKAKIRLK